MVRIIGIIAALACVTSPAFSQATTVDDLPPATVGVKTLSVTLTGEAEVPGPGAAGGRGSAFLVLHPNAGRLCFALKLSNMPVPNAAHIHEGAEGVAGEPIVDLNVSAERFGGCVTDLDSKLMLHISSNPSNFYLNVHTQQHPAGAVRGQLSD